MGESVEESMSKVGEIRFGQSHKIMAFMCPERDSMSNCVTTVVVL